MLHRIMLVKAVSEKSIVMINGMAFFMPIKKKREALK